MAEATSSSLRRAAGWLALTVLVTIVFGTLALWLTDRANHRQLEDFRRIIGVVDAARLGQVHFKTQVQEWKNVLLRGQDAVDYERYLGQFHTQAARTLAELERAAAAKRELSLDAADVEAAIEEHAALMREYEAALHGYQQGAPASVFAVDASIRGKDRSLHEKIDAIADAMQQEADRRLETFAREDARRYRWLRGVFVAMSAATMLLLARLVVLTLRRRSFAPPP